MALAQPGEKQEYAKNRRRNSELFDTGSAFGAWTMLPTGLQPAHPFRAGAGVSAILQDASMSDQLSSDLAALRIDRGPKPKSSSGGKGPLKAIVVVLLLGGAAAGVYTYAKPHLEATFFKTEVAVTQISLLSPAQASVEL